MNDAKDRERMKRQYYYEKLSEVEEKRKNKIDREMRKNNKDDINAKDREGKKRKADSMAAEEKRIHNERG